MAASRPVGRSFYNLANVFRNTYGAPSTQCNACNYCSQQVAHASTTPNNCTPLHAAMQTHTPSAPPPMGPAPPCPEVPRINRRVELDFEELKALQTAGAISLIDVRHPHEIEKQGEIPGSVNIPLCKIKVALQLSEDEWAQEFCMDKPCKLDRNLVFYARGPNASIAAVEIAHRLGFKKSRHYIGGWEDYCRQTGQPLKRVQQDDSTFGVNGNFYQDRFDQYFL